MLFHKLEAPRERGFDESDNFNKDYHEVVQAFTFRLMILPEIYKELGDFTIIPKEANSDIIT